MKAHRTIAFYVGEDTPVFTLTTDAREVFRHNPAWWPRRDRFYAGILWRANDSARQHGIALSDLHVIYELGPTPALQLPPPLRSHLAHADTVLPFAPVENLDLSFIEPGARQDYAIEEILPVQGARGCFFRYETLNAWFAELRIEEKRKRA